MHLLCHDGPVGVVWNRAGLEKAKNLDNPRICLKLNAPVSVIRAI